MTISLNKGRAANLLDLTPMIDMVFNLLIFFMVVSRFAQEDRELDVILPSASEARPLTARPKEVFVNIDQQGRYFVEGNILEDPEVEAYLLRAARDNPLGQSVVIRADKRVQFDSVVVVMNLCNKAGIRDYTVTTQGEQ